MNKVRYILGLLLLWVVLSADAANKSFTLVIDAGHGGHDAGAVGKISKEKNLTLKFALAFGRLVERNCPDVKVIYTRKTDRFVELYRRAEIANRAKADLFISFHINALPRGRIARGFQTYTLGTSKRTGQKTGVLQNLEVAKRENSVIFLEKDYKQTYQGYDPNSPESNIMFEFVQDKNMENSVELAKYMQKYVCQATGRQDLGAQQDNLAVLRLSSMPGCLIELGFISTRDEENYMNSAAAESQYARGVFNAFLNYRKRHGGNITIPYMPADDPQPVAQPVPSKQQPEEEPQPEQQRMMDEPVAEPQMVPEQQQNAANQETPAQQDNMSKQENIQRESQQLPNANKEDQPVSEPEPEKPLFKVQILASSTRLKSGDVRFKGLDHIDYYQEGGVYKYTVGASENYNEMYQLRKSIVDKFPQAFIIAFKNGARTDINAAIREFKNRYKKK